MVQKQDLCYKSGIMRVFKSNGKIITPSNQNYFPPHRLAQISSKSSHQINLIGRVEKKRLKILNR